MRIVCSNCIEHNRFAVIAHIAQEWVVDSAGNFTEIMTECTETIHYPDNSDYYTCAICGADAYVQSDDGMH